MKYRTLCSALALTLLSTTALADWQLRRVGTTPNGELRGSYASQGACQKALEEALRQAPQADFMCTERK